MKIYVGRFYEEDIKSGKDKAALAQKQKEYNLKYNDTKLIYKGKQPIAIDIWACDVEDFTL